MNYNTKYTRSMNGLNNIEGDSISCTTFTTNDATINNDITVKRNAIVNATTTTNNLNVYNNATISGATTSNSMQSNTTLTAVGKTTVGDGALTSPASTRDFNVVSTNGGIKLARNHLSSGAFVEIDSYSPDWLTLNNRVGIFGGVNGDERLTIKFRVPDFDSLILRRASSNFYTPVNITGNLVVSGTVTSSGSTGKTYGPLTDTELFQYLYGNVMNSKGVYRNFRTSTIDYANAYLSEGAAQTLPANSTFFYLIKLNANENYTGAYFKIAGNGGATCRMGIYDTGGALLYSSANTTTISGWNFVDFDFTSTTTKYVYLALSAVGITLSVVTLSNLYDLNAGKAPVSNSLVARAQYCGSVMPNPVSGTMTAPSYVIPMGVY